MVNRFLIANMNLAILLWFWLAPLHGFASELVTRHISDGALIGTQLGSKEKAVMRFAGIPYAKAPIGQLRWHAPEPVEAWQGERDATLFGSACAQNTDSFSGMPSSLQSEDCLVLNVWAPVESSKTARPVMVWLHGGAHRIGAGSLPIYDGEALAQRGVVVVTLNYRLGYFGYFTHPALEAIGQGGNLGLMDEILALKWVQKNIAAFGGDPGRVTLFGESAGGVDITLLMTSAAARGLFQRAIIQSGGGWGKFLTRKKMREKILDDFNGAGIDSDTSLEVLQNLPTKVVLDALSSRELGFGPFIDDKIVVEAPYRVFNEGREAPVPLIIGSNSWEGNLMKVAGIGIMGEILARIPPVTNWYQERVSNTEQRKEQLFGDVAFEAPARWIAQMHNAVAATWLYYFSYVRESQRGQLPGAGHGSEIMYVFNTLDKIPNLQGAVSEMDRGIADEMTDCWASFAHRGEPNCAQGWPRFENNKQQLLWVDNPIHVSGHPHAETLDHIQRWFKPD